jgi:hypothetical protein
MHHAPTEMIPFDLKLCVLCGSKVFLRIYTDLLLFYMWRVTSALTPNAAYKPINGKTGK